MVCHYSLTHEALKNLCLRINLRSDSVKCIHMRKFPFRLIDMGPHMRFFLEPILQGSRFPKSDSSSEARGIEPQG